MSHKHTISVYNPATGQVEHIEVSEAVYNEYRRGGWCIENNDRRFRKHEIPFVDLKGGLHGTYENFDEFRSNQSDPEQLVIEKSMLHELQRAMDGFTENDRALLYAIFVDGKSEREIAAEQGVSQVAIHKRKQRFIKILKKLLI